MRLGDIGGEVADALEILRHEQQMRAGGDVARILDHVGQELAEQARVHLVELFVAQPHRERLVGVALDIGVENVLDHLLAEMAHARDGVRPAAPAAICDSASERLATLAA